MNTFTKLPLAAGSPLTQPPPGADCEKPGTLDPDNEGCDLCSAHPVVAALDGDKLCQTCADKWVRAEQPDDDLVPLSKMQDALESYRRLTDPELLALGKTQRHHQRERRHG